MSGLEFLQFCMKHPELIPQLGDPISIYYLHSLENFIQAWQLWLGPSVKYYLEMV